MNGYKTLTGVSLEELPARLDEQLPADAYSAVPGGAELTDIDPGYMRKMLNELFGICGLGWGYDYTEAAINDHLTGETGQKAHEGTVTRLEFWYVLVDAQGAQTRCTIPASGGSENRNASYALKGAITNAIGQAASNLGFQESVYLGKRSHKTVRATGSKPTAAAPATRPAPTPAMSAPATPAKPSGNGHKPAAALAPAPAAIAEIEDLDEPAGEPSANPGDYVIPLGKNQGKKLSEVSQEWVKWAANDMQATTDAAKALKAAAQAFISSWPL